MSCGQAVDATPAMMWETDDRGAVVWTNRRWSEFVGHDLDAASGQGWIDSIHPDDLAPYLARFGEALRDARPLVHHYRLRRWDGTWRWILDAADPRRDAEGRFQGLAGVALDVTEHKASMAELKDSEAHFRALAEASREVVWLTDAADGAVLFVNPAFEDVFGAPRETLRAPDRLIESGAAEADREAVRAAVLAARRGDPVEVEYRYVRPDGTQRVLQDVRIPVFDTTGRLRWLGARIRDVTERRRAQEALRYSEQRFRRFADYAEEVVAVMDIETQRLDYLNPAFETVTGVKVEDCLGDPNCWRTLGPPEDHARVEAAILAAARGRRTEVKWRVQRPDGSVRTVHSSKFPLLDDQGRRRWVGSLTRDITDVVRTREELERRVAERTRELEESLEERRKAEAALAQAQRLETVGRLTGGVAHDFNNLLTVIIGALDMILKKPGAAERTERLGQAALDAARRGERLARQLLGFARRQDLRVEPVDLRGLILGFEPILRGAVGDATPLTLDVDPAVGGACLDPVHFEAALLNLVVNANDALGKGGRIRVEAAPVRLGPGDLPDVEPGEYARVSVIDTGAGMPPEVVARAFEPFFTTKGVGKGSGLGLAQVYGFARQSGGGARITSAPGEGTTVSLYLPLRARPEAKGPEPRKRIDIPLERQCHVLLVDDDPAVRELVRELLSDMGCNVVAAADGEGALTVLQTDPKVRLLVSDIVMPGMSGVELARAARRLRPGLRVVLSTGYASDRLEAMEEDWEVLRKPYRAEDLAQAARRALA